MPSVHREQPYSRRISSSAEWLPGQGPGTNTRVPEKPKERLAQTLCSLSGNFLLALPKLHGPRNSVTNAPISPGVHDEYKCPSDDRKWSLFIPLFRETSREVPAAFV